MDTRLLHEKINRFELAVKDGKLSKDFARELVIDIRTWIVGIESYISDIEIDQSEVNCKIIKLQERIDLLTKLIIISGNASILTAATIMDEEKFKAAVEFLYSSKDRNNVNKLYLIGLLMDMAKGKQFETVKQLSDYVRTGI